MISHFPHVRSSPSKLGSFKTHRLRRIRQVQRLFPLTAVMLSGTERVYNLKIWFSCRLTQPNRTAKIGKSDSAERSDFPMSPVLGEQ